jgi:hypothetical protein
LRLPVDTSSLNMKIALVYDITEGEAMRNPDSSRMARLEASALAT